MTRRALCVGINEFKTLPQSSWLNGCVNDAEDIAATLKKNGFQARNVTVLRDAEATKEAIMNALTGMIRKSKPGGTWRDWDDELVADCHKAKTGKTYPSVYGRLEWESESWETRGRPLPAAEVDA